MTLGVVIPCHRQERYLARTIGAIERALDGHAWRGALVMAAPASGPLPAFSLRWQVIAPPRSSPLTPGAARMLGFAACEGEWVLFVDADVELERAWAEAALAAMGRAEDAALAGLGGRLEEWFEDAAGERRGAPDMYGVGETDRRVDYLATLACYRRTALIAAGGYDARLSSEEDFELGLRMRGLGLELRSLGVRAGRHWSAPRPSFEELARRWQTGLCFGQGQVLRLYAGRPGFGALLRRQALYLATLAMWGLGLIACAASIATRSARPFAMWSLLPLAVLAVMGARKRSGWLGLHSLLAWTLNGLGLAVGLFRLRGRGGSPASGGAAC